MNKEYIREKLTSLRLYVTIVATLNSACIAWFVGHFKTANGFLKVANLMSIIFLSIFFSLLSMKLVKDAKLLKIKEIINQ